MAANAEITAPKLRPGERLVAGRPYVFNQDLLNACMADEALEEAPADLSVLSDRELRSLRASWLNRFYRFTKDDALVRAVEPRLFAEFGRRGWDSAGRQNSAPPARSKAA